MITPAATLKYPSLFAVISPTGRIIPIPSNE